MTLPSLSLLLPRTIWTSSSLRMGMLRTCSRRRCQLQVLSKNSDKAKME